MSVPGSLAMIKIESQVDPKVEKRRQKNKVASAKCRERKLKRAQLLQQEVTKMKQNVEEKKLNVKKLTSRIEDLKKYFEQNSDFLSEEEKTRFKELLAKAGERPDPTKNEQDMPTSSYSQVIVDTGQIHSEKHSFLDKLNDSGNETSGDDDYKPPNDDVSSPDKESEKTGPPKKRKYIRRNFNNDD